MASTRSIRNALAVMTGAALIGQWPEAAVVIWLFGLAELIEALSLERARHAIRALVELAPETARRREGDSWVEVATDTAVLNADDELCLKMADYTTAKNLCYVTMNPRHPLVREHIRAGARAVVLEDGLNGQQIVLYDNGRHIPLLWTHLIPATMEGRALHNVQNAMVATAVARYLAARDAGHRPVLLAGTNDLVDHLNLAVLARLIEGGDLDDASPVSYGDGRFRAGERVVIRHNSRQATTAELTPLVNKLEQQLITRDWLAVDIAASSEAITAIGTVMQFDGWV